MLACSLAVTLVRWYVGSSVRCLSYVLRRLAMHVPVQLAPPVLSYVPFGAARTSPLSYVAFGAAGVSYAGGAAARKSRKIQRPQNGRFRTVLVRNLPLPVEFSYN